MVSKKTTKRKTVGILSQLAQRRRLLFGSIVLFLGIITFLVTFGVGVSTSRSDTDIDASDSQETVEPVEPEQEQNPDEMANITSSVSEIDFQPIIDEWVNLVGGSKGIAMYDLDLDIMVGQYNADEKFSTASLYKLFVVYEGYRRLQNGDWNESELKCLDLAIRESNSECAETMWAKIGRDELDNIVQQDFNLTNVSVKSLSATPREIVQMMKIFYEHKEITDESLISRMQDSFLNQPITTYNWRQGLPSGFSDAVNVYNKVGWHYIIDEEDKDGNVKRGHWGIYDDAAILDFTENSRHFIVVVMTNNVDYRQIRRFGTMIETYYQENQ